MNRIIELLAPARNLSCGLEAVRHGADAVYIGGPAFGARADAGNSISDIEQLIRYAHPFQVKVYVVLNTILSDLELEEAVKLSHQLYQSGVDALIVQDMGLLLSDMPPIPLFASTQTDIRTPEKVQFLESVGFSRAILARETSIATIQKMHEVAPAIDLEAFVHGALCVSYSGKCYMSQNGCGRSANRGLCAQYCRLPYSLEDGVGNVLVHEKHLLSLKDMDRSDSLEEMIEAGITSFKIEGRLKDANYVKNITAYYRERLDAVFEKSGDMKSSRGTVRLSFEPNPQKSFHRGKTEYFLHDNRDDIAQTDTPKSIGEPVGEVMTVTRRSIDISPSVEIHNGDGCCFIGSNGFGGFRVNRAEVRPEGIYRLYPVTPATLNGILPFTTLYRNHDMVFHKQLSGQSAERTIALDILFKETSEGFLLQATDETGISVSLNLESEKNPAQKEEEAKAQLASQFSHLGDTIYTLREFSIETSQIYFFPFSTLNQWRRDLVDLLTKTTAKLQKEEREKQVALPHNTSTMPYPDAKNGVLSYFGNVHNATAEKFYRLHGVTSIDASFEQDAPKDAVLMTCKYCLRYELGWCTKNRNEKTPSDPLFLVHGDKRYRLRFNCARCEMKIIG